MCLDRVLFEAASGTPMKGPERPSRLLVVNLDARSVGVHAGGVSSSRKPNRLPACSPKIVELQRGLLYIRPIPNRRGIRADNRATYNR